MDRSTRAMTLTEMTIVLVLLAILALILATGGTRSVNDRGDADVQNLLNAVVQAQHIRHDTLGSFATQQVDLDALVGGVTVVAAGTAVTDAGTFSMSVTAGPGDDVIFVAGVGRSGRCYAVQSYEPAAPIPDQRRRFDPGPAGCSADAAAANQAGEPW